MNSSRIELKKNINISKKLPIIKKIIPIRTIIDHSSPSNRSISNARSILYFYYPKKQPNIVLKNNIKTTLYKVNDYLAMTHKDVFNFSPINSLNKTRNKNEGLYLKKNRSDIGQDKNTIYYLYHNNSTGDFNSTTSTNQNSKINKINFQQNNLFNRSVNSLFNDSSTNNHNKIKNIKYFPNKYEERIHKINDFKLNIIKNSKYFKKTKYINGIKNKIMINQKNINKSLSTKNLSLEKTCNTSNRRKYNDIQVEKLLLKQKNNSEFYQQNNNEDKISRKADEIGEKVEPTKLNNAIFYDFIPIILQHMKQKEILGEIKNDSNHNERLYNNIKSIYKDNSKELTKSIDLLKSKTKNDLLENPIIQYLFLERTLNNIKHNVDFVDIKNRKEFEQKVLKIMGDEYSKIKDTQNINDIHDFETCGYEFDPKLFIFLKQLQRKKELLEYEKMNKDINKKIETRMPIRLINKNQKEFFTTNKIDFKTDDNIKSEITTGITSGGILHKIMMSGVGISNKIRSFEGLKDGSKDRKRISFPFTKKKFSPMNMLIHNNIKNDKKKDIYKNLESVNEITEHEKNEKKNIDINNYLEEFRKKLNQEKQDINISVEKHELIEEEKKDKNSNILEDKDKEKYNSNINKSKMDLEDVTHIINDIQTKDKIKKRHGDNNIKMYSIKKKKLKKKSKVELTEKQEKQEKVSVPPINLDLINSGITPDQPLQEEKKVEEPKKPMIKNKFDYERYKNEKIRQNERNRRAKSIILAELKIEDAKNILNKKKTMFSELFNKSIYKKDSFDDRYNVEKKFEKKKRKDEDKNDEDEDEEDNIIERLRKLREKKSEEEEEDESGSLFSSENDDEFSDNFDLSKDMENNDILKKKWMENSPKFKNRIISKKKRRNAVSVDSLEKLNNLYKKDKIEDLNDKINRLYYSLDKKRKDKKNKKNKKKKPFSFKRVNLKSIIAIEAQKKIYLNRIKDDIKYKIREGRYHLIELDNFKIFEEAMNKFKLKNAVDQRKVKIYVKLVEKYLTYYQNDLDNREKEKIDEDRINKFLRNLNQEIYVTLPYIKDVKGRYCHSVDYFKQLQELSELHDF